MQENLRNFVNKLHSTDRIDGLNYIDFKDLAALQFDYAKKNKTLYINNPHPYEFAFLTNLMASRDILAQILGCQVNDVHKKFLSLLKDPIKPTLVATGRCQDQVCTGRKIDLGLLPALKFSREDVGPYLTAGIVIAKDPETKKRNISIHRMEIKGNNKLGIRLEPTSHLFQIQNKAETMNQGLEVAVVIGNHPAELLASVSSLDYGADELDIAGAIRGESLELVKCKTVDLEVPAGAEIVIEGFIPHHTKEVEGPFGDFMGYYVEPIPNHLVNVTAITFTKDNPIFQSISAGSLEDCLLLGFAKEVAIYQALVAKGIRVFCVNVSPMVFNCAIAVTKQKDNEPEEVIKTAFENDKWLKYCVVVDEDVNCYDLTDLWWAIATRSTPKNNIIYKEMPGFPRDPYQIHQGKMGIDATVPLDLKHFFRRANP
ncbi:MAG: hypothetical protein APF76_12800 [Desulfitibacter sp. BRH_c19]|nr:MAG: hypothetical protein APF76_12800 [Desulfitibacter sp. BRH_c19]